MKIGSTKSPLWLALCLLLLSSIGVHARVTVSKDEGAEGMRPVARIRGERSAKDHRQLRGRMMMAFNGVFPANNDDLLFVDDAFFADDAFGFDDDIVVINVPNTNRMNNRRRRMRMRMRMNMMASRVPTPAPTPFPTGPTPAPTSAAPTTPVPTPAFTLSPVQNRPTFGRNPGNRPMRMRNMRNMRMRLRPRPPVRLPIISTSSSSSKSMMSSSRSRRNRNGNTRVELAVRSVLEYFPIFRNPTDFEVNALLDETEAFFDDELNDETGDQVTNLRIQNVGMVYFPNTNRVQLAFTTRALVPWSSGINAEDMALVMGDANFNNYLRQYVWQSEPVGRNAFWDTQSVDFNGQAINRGSPIILF